MPATAVIYQQTQKCTIPILVPQANSEEHTSTSGKVMMMMMVIKTQLAHHNVPIESDKGEPMHENN